MHNFFVPIVEADTACVHQLDGLCPGERCFTLTHAIRQKSLRMLHLLHSLFLFQVVLGVAVRCLCQVIAASSFV